MAAITTELIRTKQDERGRRITPAAEREALVQAYTESGLTQKAFAEREGVKYPTLVSWIQASGQRKARPKVGFAELTMARAPGPLEVQLADGTVIRGGNAEDIARLLQLVRC
jgi:transposase-like protein